MTRTRLLLAAAVAGALASPAAPAFAQSAVDPVTGGVCGLINFSFCPQGIPPTPLPDPEGEAERAAPARAPVAAAYAPPPPVHAARHRKRHRTGATTVPPSTDDQ